jgi:hypothetical protein
MSYALSSLLTEKPPDLSEASLYFIRRGRLPPARKGHTAEEYGGLRGQRSARGAKGHSWSGCGRRNPAFRKGTGRSRLSMWGCLSRMAGKPTTWSLGRTSAPSGGTGSVGARGTATSPIVSPVERGPDPQLPDRTDVRLETPFGNEVRDARGNFHAGEELYEKTGGLVKGEAPEGPVF